MSDSVSWIVRNHVFPSSYLCRSKCDLSTSNFVKVEVNVPVPSESSWAELPVYAILILRQGCKLTFSKSCTPGWLEWINLVRYQRVFIAFTVFNLQTRMNLSHLSSLGPIPRMILFLYVHASNLHRWFNCWCWCGMWRNGSIRGIGSKKFYKSEESKVQ